MSCCQKEDVNHCNISTIKAYQDIIGFPDNPDFPKKSKKEEEDCEIT
jgi:hypothetical protein